MPLSPVKDRLKTMSRGSGRHFFRTTGRITKYGIIGFGRNIWLSITATLVMTFTLIVLFTTVIASVILNSTAEAMREKIDITIFFKPGTELSRLESMASTMKSDKNIKSVVISTTEEEYNKFLEENNANKEIITTFDDNTMKEIMLKALQATMRIKVHNADDLSSIKEIVNKDPEFVENLDTQKIPTYNTDSSAIATIVSWANMAKNGGLALSIIFLIISNLVIFNTIRMAIFSRSEEIYMEKLVGADNRFIRGPFLIEAMISGAAAGILASILGFSAFQIIAPRLAGFDIDVSVVSKILNSYQVIYVFLVIIGVGMFIGLISSRLAVQKYLKKI